MRAEDYGLLEVHFRITASPVATNCGIPTPHNPLSPTPRHHDTTDVTLENDQMAIGRRTKTTCGRVVVSIAAPYSRSPKFCHGTELPSLAKPKMPVRQ